MSWNPEQYLKFATSRLRPALDLLNRIALAAPRSVYDLGCGAGNVTRLLMERWPGADICGVDDSAEMLAKARRELPSARWLQASLADWVPLQPADLIYSNAALHWLPDHENLLPRLFGHLTPGGVLAVQMPRNFNAPSHTLVTETIRSPRWCERFAGLNSRPPVGDPTFYYELLAPLAKSIDLWETEYTQVLEGPDPVKEWTKGTWLMQFLEVLPAGERDDFERDYAARVALAYPRRPDGRTLFPFRRLFMVVKK